MEKAVIDAAAFNRMVDDLKLVVTNTQGHPNAYMMSHIHINAADGKLVCRACDGYRVNEDIIPVVEMSEPFSCSINVPRLKARNYVVLTLDGDMAYVEFDDVRFATKQKENGVLDLSASLSKGTGAELHEYRLNAKYLYQAAVSMMRDQKSTVILQTGVSKGLDFVILRGSGVGIQQARYVLPVRWGKY